MKKNKLLIAIGAVIALVVLCFWLSQDQNPIADSKVVRIGAILPLTGPVGEDGRMALAALQIAEEAVCSSNDIKCKFYYEDGKYDAKTTITCFNKLMVNRPDALMVLGDVPNNSLSSMIASSKMIDLALVTCDEILIGGNDWMFAGWFPFSVENEVLCKYAVENLKVKRVGILALRNNFGDDAVRTFKNAANQLHCTVVATESYDMDSPDVKSQIAKILNHNPDAVYVAGFGQGYISAFNELLSSGYKGHLLSNTAISIDGNRMNIVNHANGVYYVDVVFDSNATDAMSFIEAFKKKTGKLPSSTFATIYAMGKHLASVAIKARNEAVDFKELLVNGGVENSIIGGFTHKSNGQLMVPLKVQRVGGR